MPSTAIVGQDEIIRAERPTAPVCAIRANLLEQIDLTDIGEALLEATRAYKIAKGILGVEFL